jgi:hypothetical protein
MGGVSFTRGTPAPKPQPNPTKNVTIEKETTNKKSAGQPHARPVHIEFNHVTATRSGIAGTFNKWRPEATPMIPLGAGRWLKELVLPPGVYDYRLVVDGEWIADPLGKEALPNPFGVLNSVIRVDG